MASRINDIEPRDAQTKQEKMLLGYLYEEAKRVKYGKISLEISVQDEQIVNMQTTEVKRNFRLG